MGLVVTLIVTGLAEVGARLSGVTPAYRPDSMGQWRMTPNLNAHRMEGMREAHDFTISTNLDGLRTRLPHARTPDTFRVALMGDSTVFGWGVADSESIAAVAEAEFHRRGLTHVEVLNAGQPGYSTGMAGWLFKEALAAYQPDLTIVFVSMHDFNRTLISDIERVRGPRGVRASVRSFSVRNVALYEMLRRKIYPLADRAQVLPHERSEEGRVPRVSENERVEVLDGMNQHAARWGGRVAVGFLPFYVDLQRDASVPDAGRPGLTRAIEWSRSNDTPVLDLRRCCGPEADSLTFSFDRGHLNARGNRVVGEALVEHLHDLSVPDAQ
jgi:lysophospholipase L1-like esterase